MQIKTKKSLGQNFLIDRNILELITDVVEIKNKEILEIGPGSGNLTAHILKKEPKKLYVIEKDDNLSLLLSEKFENKIKIINDDVLQVSEKNISNEKLTVFGNLPYNISTEILSRWIISLDKKFSYLITIPKKTFYTFKNNGKKKGFILNMIDKKYKTK